MNDAFFVGIILDRHPSQMRASCLIKMVYFFTH